MKNNTSQPLNNIAKIIILIIFTVCKNWSWTSLSMFYLLKIIPLTIKMRRTIPKLVTKKMLQCKATFSRKTGFSKNLTALTLLSKVLPCSIILVQNRFLNLIIWKPKAQAFQNAFTFDWQLFLNSKSNFHVNLVHWNSLHP